MRFNGPSVKRKAVVMDADGKYMNKEAGPTTRRVLCQPKGPPPSKFAYLFQVYWGNGFFTPAVVVNTSHIF